MKEPFMRLEPVPGKRDTGRPRRALPGTYGMVMMLTVALAAPTLPVWGADPAEPRRPRVILMNDDSVLY